MLVNIQIHILLIQGLITTLLFCVTPSLPLNLLIILHDKIYNAKIYNLGIKSVLYEYNVLPTLHVNIKLS